MTPQKWNRWLVANAKQLTKTDYSIFPYIRRYVMRAIVQPHIDSYLKNPLIYSAIKKIMLFL